MWPHHLFNNVPFFTKPKFRSASEEPPLFEADYHRSEPKTSGNAVKRALIIGINYRKKSKGPEKQKKLRWGHRDARAWAELLKRKYGYVDSEITLMLDERGYPASLMPSKKNILHQIGRLVHGLEENSGSRLVFYYSGHSSQVPSDSIREEDGLDECLVPIQSGRYDSSADDKILDDHLRKHLVDSIPEGVFLTAIFDACHSGTMLDLDHYQCNAVYFPWLNRGKRRNSRSLWQLVMRKNALLPIDSSDRGFLRITSLTPQQAALTTSSSDHALGDSSTSPRSIPSLRGRKKQRTENNIRSIASVLDEPPARKVKRPLPTRAATCQVPSEDTPAARKKTRAPVRCYSFDHRFDLAASKFRESLWAFMGIRQQSPEPSDPRMCMGWCQAVGGTSAYIVSISATNDAQVAYDGPGGQSMTQNLIKILEETPHISYHELVERLGYEQHGVIRQVHEACRNQFEEIRKKKELEKDKKRQEQLDQEQKSLQERMDDEGENGMKCILDGSNFQDPTLGSQRPLTEYDIVIM